MPHSHMIHPFSIPGGLAGLARGLGNGWPAVEERANHVLALLASAPRQRTKPAVLLVQLLAYVTVHRDNTTEPVPSHMLDLILRVLAVVLGVEKHVDRLAVLSGGLSSAEAARQLGISERTVRRWQADGLGPPSARGALELADRHAKGGRSRNGVAEALHDLATAEVSSGTYFSTPLLWALAEVLGVGRRDIGLTQGATDVLHGGVRHPNAFIAAGLAEGRLDLERTGEGGAKRILRTRGRRGLDEDPASQAVATSVNEVAVEAGVEWATARRWRQKDSPHVEAFEFNRFNAATFTVSNASGRSRRREEAEAFLTAVKTALLLALEGRRSAADRDTLRTALLLCRSESDHPTVRALKRQAPEAWADFVLAAPRKRRI